MKTGLAVAALLVMLVLGFVGYLFWVQNSSQLVTVSLEFWGIGRHGRTWSAPELMAVCFGSGAVVAGLPAFVSNIRQRSKVRRLEQQVKLSSGDTSSNWR